MCIIKWAALRRTDQSQSWWKKWNITLWLQKCGCHLHCVCWEPHRQKQVRVSFDEWVCVWLHELQSVYIWALCVFVCVFPRHQRPAAGDQWTRCVWFMVWQKLRWRGLQRVRHYEPQMETNGVRTIRIRPALSFIYTHSAVFAYVCVCVWSLTQWWPRCCIFNSIFQSGAGPYGSGRRWVFICHPCFIHDLGGRMSWDTTEWGVKEEE